MSKMEEEYQVTFQYKLNLLTKNLCLYLIILSFLLKLQCTKWGRVDWIKDYIDNDSVIRLSAAMLFIYYTLNPKYKPLAKQDNYTQIQQSLKQ